LKSPTEKVRELDFARLKERLLRILIKLFLIFLSLFIGFSGGILAIEGILFFSNMLLVPVIVGVLVMFSLSTVFIRWFWGDL